MANPNPKDELARFLEQNPELDVARTTLDAATLDRLDWSGVERAAITEALHTRQRMRRLHADPAVTALLGDHFASAHDIAAMGHDDFVDHCVHTAGIDVAAAAAVHRRAVDMRARAALYAANLRDVMTSPHCRTPGHGDLGADLLARAEAHHAPPAGVAADAVDAAPSRPRPTIFSPQKYALELRSLIDEKIHLSRSVADRLSTRRPDLDAARMRAELLGDEVPMPYVQLATRVITARLAALGVGTPERDVAAASTVYPFTLPYHAPQDRIETWLSHFDLDRRSVLDRFDAPAEAGARATLGLSHEVAALIRTAETGEGSLKARFGVDDLDGLKRVARFLDRTDMTRDALDTLVHQDLDLRPDAQNRPVEGALRAGFFVNRGGGTPLAIERVVEGTRTVETLAGLDAAALDRICRFVRLARSLGWSFTDLDWVLESLGVTGPDIAEADLVALARVADLARRFDAPLDIIGSLWGPMKTRGRGTGARSQALFDRVFNSPEPFDAEREGPYRPAEDAGNPTFGHATLKWRPRATDEPFARRRQRLRAALSLSDDGLDALVAALCPAPSNGATWEIGLTVPVLSRLFRHSRLAALLNLPVGELLALMALLDIAEITAVEHVTRLVAWADRLAASGVSVHLLGYLMSGAPGDYVDPGYSPSEVDGLIARFPDVAPLQASDLVTPGIDQATAEAIITRLKQKDVLDAKGRVAASADQFTYAALKTMLADLLPPAPLAVLDFDESEKRRVYVDCGAQAQFDIADALTLEVWVKSPGKTNGLVIHRGGPWATPGYAIYWAGADTTPDVRLHLTETEVRAGTARIARPPLGRWCHIALTWDAATGEMRVHVDGALLGEPFPFGHTIGATNEPLQLGSATNLSGYVTHFVGHMADVRIWQRRRTADEIRRDMHRRLKGDEPGLVGYWPMDEGAGATVADHTSHGAHGRIARHGSADAPTWSTVADLPLDLRLTAVRDALHAGRSALDAAGLAIRARVAEFFGARLDRSDAALRFAGHVRGCDPLSTLISARGSGVHGPAQILIGGVAHALRLASTFDLDAAGLHALVDHPERFARETGSGAAFDAGALRALDHHRQLTARFRALPGGVSAIFDAAAPRDQLAAASGWHGDAIDAALAALGLDIASITVDDLQALGAVFDLVTATGMSATALKRLADLHGPVDTGWQAWLDGAEACLAAIDARCPPGELQGVIEPLQDRLDVGLRDALADLCGHRLGFAERREDLYEHLLIDVEMGGCARISPLKQAINSLQLYVHRCRAGLEPGAIAEISEAEWRIMGAYRRWEARQKLRTFPENYLDPGLRTRKTPLYAELQQTLQQGELDDAGAEDAVRQYLRGFEIRANLRPMAACYATIDDPHSGLPRRALFIVGRGRSAPFDWYVRRCIVGMGDGDRPDIIEWGPWQAIPAAIGIQAERITVVHAYGRLFLFWVSTTEERHTRLVDGASVVTVGTKARIEYMHQEEQGGWSGAQTLLDDTLIHVWSEEKGKTTEATKALIRKQLPAYEPWMEGTPLDHTAWRCVWAQHLPDQLGDETLVVLFGLPTGVDRYRHHWSGPIGPFLLDANLEIRQSDVRTDGWAGKIRRAHRLAKGGIVDAPAFAPYVDNWYGNYHADDTRALLGTPAGDARVLPVTNLLGWALIDNGDEAFLVFAERQQLPELSRSSSARFEQPVAPRPSVVLTHHAPAAPTGKVRFVRLTTAAAPALTGRLASGGIDHLLSVDAQQTPEPHFDRLGPLAPVAPPASATLDLSGPYERYLNEIFLHIPFLMGVSLHAAQRYEAARRWLRFVFDPENQPDDPAEWDAERRKQEELITLRTLDGAASSRAGVEFHEVTDLPGTDRRKVLWLKPDGSTMSLGPLLSELNFTVEFWVYIEPPKDNSPQRLLYEDALRGLRVMTRGSRLCFFANGLFAQTAQPLQPRRWHHCAFSLIKRDRWYARCHLDGELQPAAHEDNDASHPQYAPIMLGGRSGGPAVRMANIAFWNRSLPTRELRHRAGQTRAGVWRFLPLRRPDLQSVLARLSDPVLLAAHAADPCDPEAAGQLRPVTLRNALIMRTVDNLIDWGDALFAKDTWETNVLATMLYVQAGDILGRRPRYAVPDSRAPSLVVDTARQRALEHHLAPAHDGGLLPQPIGGTPDPDFRVPDNAEWAGYWDRIADRLHKLRNCMNLEGEQRQLALYRAPIDPRRLADVMAAAEDLSLPVDDAGRSRLTYEDVAPRAMRAARHLQRMGQALLAAVESLDGADVDMLELAHERELFDLTEQIKQQEIAEQEQAIAALELGRGRAIADVARHGLLLSGVTDGTLLDIASIQAQRLKLAFVVGGISPKAAAVALYLPPKVFGVASGKPEPGQASEAVNGAFGEMAEIAGTVGDMLAASADIVRRKEEQAANVASSAVDVTIFDRDLAAARLRLDILHRELEAEKKARAQWVEKNALIQGQFTGPDLYRWMSRRLSGLYLQAYSVTFGLALDAQRAYRDACESQRQFVRFDHWDALRKGLLAAEGLIVDLERLDRAYHAERAKAQAVIEHDVDLGALDAEALSDLRREGRCTFALGERLFDQTQPGDYARRIVSVEVSVRGRLGRQPVRATLELLGHRTVIRPDVEAARFLLGERGARAPGADRLWRDDRVRRSVASGRAVDGACTLRFDEAVFAGAGAVSRWALRIPQAANRFPLAAIDDVTLHLRYSARHGGPEFTRAIVETRAVSHFEGHHCVSLAAADPAQWADFVAGAGDSRRLTARLTADALHPGIDPATLSIGRATDGGQRAFVVLRHAPGIAAETLRGLPLTINGRPWDGARAECRVPAPTDGGWTFTVELDALPAAFADGETGALDTAALADILLLVPFEGRLDWRGVL